MPVDCVIDLFARENVRKNFSSHAVVVVELLTRVRKVDVELRAHEFFDAVSNGGELVDTNLGVRSFFDFAGQGTINDCGRRIAIAELPFRNTNGKNGAVKLVKRLAYRHVCFFQRNFDWRDDFAELFVSAHLGDVKRGLLFDYLAVFGFSEIEDDFGNAVVRYANHF